MTPVENGLCTHVRLCCRSRKPPPLHTIADWKVVLHLPEIQTWLRATSDRVSQLTHSVGQDGDGRHVDVHLVQLKVVFVLFLASDGISSVCVCVCVGTSVGSALRLPITHNALPLSVTSLLRNDPHLPSRRRWCVYVTGWWFKLFRCFATTDKRVTGAGTRRSGEVLRDSRTQADG